MIKKHNFIKEDVIENAIEQFIANPANDTYSFNGGKLKIKKELNKDDIYLFDKDYEGEKFYFCFF